jgi:hypothetical protein
LQINGPAIVYAWDGDLANRVEYSVSIESGNGPFSYTWATNIIEHTESGDSVKMDWGEPQNAWVEVKVTDACGVSKTERKFITVNDSLVLLEPHTELVLGEWIGAGHWVNQSPVTITHETVEAGTDTFSTNVEMGLVANTDLFIAKLKASLGAELSESESVSIEYTYRFSLEPNDSIFHWYRSTRTKTTGQYQMWSGRNMLHEGEYIHYHNKDIGVGYTGSPVPPMPVPPDGD